jgi:hypothetical protein
MKKALVLLAIFIAILIIPNYLETSIKVRPEIAIPEWTDKVWYGIYRGHDEVKDAAGRIISVSVTCEDTFNNTKCYQRITDEIGPCWEIFNEFIGYPGNGNVFTIIDNGYN